MEVIGRGAYRLLDSYRYHWEHEGEKFRLTVKQSFRTDLASVPDWLHSFIGQEDLGLGPPIHHDALYRCGGDTWTSKWIDQMALIDEEEMTWINDMTPWSRHNADRLFGRMMREKKIKQWRRRMAYRGVRVFGWWVWDDE